MVWLSILYVFGNVLRSKCKVVIIRIPSNLENLEVGMASCIFTSLFLVCFIVSCHGIYECTEGKMFLISKKIDYQTILLPQKK